MTEQQESKPERLSLSDTINSLTGFEEVAIEEKFGKAVGVLLNEHLSRCGRALIFVVEQRNGAKPGEAYERAMTMRLDEVNDRFFGAEEDADDVDPDQPYSDQGKDDTPSD